jgi:hypothetical protein
LKSNAISSKGADAIIAAIDAGEQVEFDKWKGSPSMTPSVGAELESPHFANSSKHDTIIMKDLKCS